VGDICPLLGRSETTDLALANKERLKMPELPQALTFLLPAATISLSAWLSHNGLPVWKNGVIVLIVTILSAFIWALLIPPITRDFWSTVLIVGVYCVALTYGPLSPLYQWLMEALPSPISLFIKEMQGPLNAVSQGMISSAVAPVPKRASALPSGKTWVRNDVQTPIGESVIDKVVPPPEQTPPS